MSFCFIYSVVLENYSVQNSPWGEGVYKQLTGYMFYMRDLKKTCILISVSSKSVETFGVYGRLNICKWTVMEAAIL